MVRTLPRKQLPGYGLGVRVPPLPLRRVWGLGESAHPPRSERGVSRFEPWIPSLSPAPVVERAKTPGPQPGSRGFESRRGFCTDNLVVGELVTPPALEAGERRFESCRPDCAVEERLSSRAS